MQNLRHLCNISLPWNPDCTFCYEWFTLVLTVIRYQCSQCVTVTESYVTFWVFSEDDWDVIMIHPVLLAGLAALYLPALGRRGFKCSPGNSRSICLPDSYSKFELPNTEKTNKIGISIDIDEVLRINDGTYSITFSTYFNVEWNERRLNVGPEFGASLRWGRRKEETQPQHWDNCFDSGLTTPQNPWWFPWT